VVLGSVISSFGQAYYLNTPSKLASAWFGDKERALATSVASLSLPFGALLGFVTPSIFIEKRFEEPSLHDEGLKQFSYYLFVQNVIITLFCIPSLFLIKDKPPSPPSCVAEVEDDMRFSEGLRDLFTNVNYIHVTLNFSLVYSIYGAIPSILSQMTEPYGYSDIDNSIFGSVFLISGVISSFAIGVMLDKY